MSLKAPLRTYMSDDLTDKEPADSLRHSIQHIVSYAQTMCGFKAETLGCGLDDCLDHHSGSRRKTHQSAM